MTKVTIDTDYFLTLVNSTQTSEAPMVPPMKSEPVKKERAPRAPSAYNKYMASEIKRLKETSEEKDNKKLFALAAANYKAAKAEGKL